MHQLGDARSGKLADNLTGFGRLLRRAGVPMDSARIALATTAALTVGLTRRDDLRAALAAVLVSRQQDLVVFEQLFDTFFRDPNLAQQLLAQMLPQAQEKARPPDRLARVQEALQAGRVPTDGPAREDEVQLDAAMSMSERERLRQADFQSLSASEFHLVEQLARQITLPLPWVPGRRSRVGERGVRIDGARTLRLAARHEGEVLRLLRRQRRPQPLPLLALVDVSGSMERYARLMLAFLHQATRRVPRAVFTFSTQLSDLRAPFRASDPDVMLREVNRHLSGFGSGTRLGPALAQLRERYHHCLVGRRTLTLLISDGLDTGDAKLLAQELGWLKRHCRSLLWLNPLLRFEGYAPLATGAQILRQHADGMLAIHNLSRLEQLAQAMGALMQDGPRAVH